MQSLEASPNQKGRLGTQVRHCLGGNGWIRSIEWFGWICCTSSTSTVSDVTGESGIIGSSTASSVKGESGAFVLSFVFVYCALNFINLLIYTLVQLFHQSYLQFISFFAASPNYFASWAPHKVQRHCSYCMVQAASGLSLLLDFVPHFWCFSMQLLDCIVW